MILLADQEIVEIGVQAEVDTGKVVIVIAIGVETTTNIVNKADLQGDETTEDGQKVEGEAQADTTIAGVVPVSVSLNSTIK